MVNKRKPKRSKRALKCLRKKIWEVRRTKKKEAEASQRTSIDQVGQLNFDVDFDPVSDVLDIKIEESEVTCHNEEDYPLIMLDHAYSRTNIKDEPDWNIGYTSSADQSCTLQDRTPRPFQTKTTATSEVQNKNRNLAQSLTSTTSAKNRSEANVKKEHINEVENVRGISLPAARDDNQIEYTSSQKGKRRRSVRSLRNSTEKKTKTYAHHEEHNYTMPYPSKSKRGRSEDGGSRYDMNLQRDPLDNNIVKTTGDKKVRDHLRDWVTSRNQSVGMKNPDIPENISLKRKRGRTRNKNVRTRNAVRRSSRLRDLQSEDDKPENNLMDYVLHVNDPNELLIDSAMRPTHANLVFTGLPVVFGGESDRSNKIEVQKTPSIIPTGILIPISVAISNTSTALSSIRDGRVSLNPQTSTNQFGTANLSLGVRSYAVASTSNSSDNSTAFLNNKRNEKVPKLNIKTDSPKKYPAFQIQTNSSIALKKTNTLRVKTQDELNASASLLANPSRLQTASSSSSSNMTEVNPPNCSYISSDDDNLPISAFRKHRKRKMKVPLILKSSKNQTHSDELTGVPEKKTARLVLGTDNRKLVKKLIIPVNRVFEPVPEKWKVRFEDENQNKSNQIGSVNLGEQSVEPSIIREISKDDSNKQSKGARRRKSEIDLLLTPSAKVEQAVNKTQVKLSLSNRLLQNPTVQDGTMNIKTYMPSFLVRNSAKIIPSSHIDPPLISSNKTKASTSRNIGQKHRRLILPKDKKLVEVVLPQEKPRKQYFNSKSRRRVAAQDELSENQFQTNISECVDNIIQNTISDTNDIEEVGVLRVDLNESQAEIRNKEDGLPTHYGKKKNSSEVPRHNLAKTSRNAAPIELRPAEIAEARSFSGNADKSISNSTVIDLTDSGTSTILDHSSIAKKSVTNPAPNQIRNFSIDNRIEKEICIADLNENKEEELPIIRVQDLEEFLGISDDEIENIQNERTGGESMIFDKNDGEGGGIGSIVISENTNKNDDNNKNAKSDDQNLNRLDRNQDKFSDEAVIVNSDFDFKSLENEPTKDVVAEKKLKSKTKRNRIRNKPIRKVAKQAIDSRSESGFVVVGEFEESSPTRSSRRLRDRKSSSNEGGIETKNGDGTGGDGAPLSIGMEAARDLPETDITDLLFTRVQFCALCRTNCSNLSSHLQQVHYDEEEVRQLINLPRGSEARRRILKKWYFIANYSATAESHRNGSHRTRCCSICLKNIFYRETLSHYFLCSSQTPEENIVPQLQHDVIADMDRLIDEIQKNFSPETWLDLAKSLLISIYILNGGLVTVEMLSIRDYSRRQAFNSEIDSQLSEMVEDVSMIKDICATDTPLKVTMVEDAIGMPLFLTPKQEEGINWLLNTGKKCSKYVFRDPLYEFRKRLSVFVAIKEYIQLDLVPSAVLERLESREKLYVSNYNMSGHAKPRVFHKGKFTRIKGGRRRLSKTKREKLCSIIASEDAEVDGVIGDLETSNCQTSSPVPLSNSIDLNEYPSEVEPVCLNEETGIIKDELNVPPKESIAIDFNEPVCLDEKKILPEVLLETDADTVPDKLLPSKSVDRILTTTSGNHRKIPVKEKRIHKNNDIYRTFYLKTSKNDSANKLTRIVVDVRDTCICERCGKYFLRSYYIKHRRFCESKNGNKSRTGKMLIKAHRKKDSQLEARNLTCPTLQSPAGRKKYFCIYCKQTLTKLHRHLEHKHKDEKEVQEMLKYPKRSREREQLMYKLRTRGTFAFNKNSEYNGGKIIVSRRPNPILQRTTGDFLPCPSCHNYFAKKTLYRHSKRCSNKQGFQKDLRRAALALVIPAHPKCNKIMANQIIPRLVEDNVSEAVKNDELLILFGNYLTRKHPYPTIRKDYIRQNLRIAAKLFLAMKTNDPSISEFSSVYKPEYCDSVVKAAMEVAGYNSETGAFTIQEISRKLGPIIKNCGLVWSMECSKTKRFEDRRLVAEFMHKFNEIYGRDVLEKLKRPVLKVQTNELKKMFEFSQDEMLKAAEQLKKDFCLDTWIQLSKCLLVHLRLLNNNIPQDGEGLYVSEYLQRHGMDSEDDLMSYHTLGLLRNFPNNYLKVNLRDSSSSLLLSKEFCSAMDILLENREDAGVPMENVYLFGRSEQRDHYKTGDAKNYLRIKASKKISTEAVVSESKSQEVVQNPNEDSRATTYSINLVKAFHHHSGRMLQLMTELRKSFNTQMWIDLVKCALACVQLINDKTYAEVVQYLLLIDYEQREKMAIDEDRFVYTTLTDITGPFFKLNMQGTPINLLLNATVCDALDTLIEMGSSANIHPENPYVFGCSGNKYNYYRTEGCIGSLPVTNGVDEILSLRSRIINDLLKNGTPGIQLWKLLPESKENLTENAIRVFYYSQSKMVELKYKLEEKFALEVWLDLIRCLMIYAHLLNNKSPVDVEKLLISDYMNRQKLDRDEDKSAYHSLDDLSDFPHNYLKVKMGEPTQSILLSLDFCETVDLLLAHRQDAGVHIDNPYVFGCRGNKENYFRAHGAAAHVAAKCGVKRFRYQKAKRVNGKVEMQEQVVDVKDISRTEREILLNNWKIERMLKASDSFDKADDNSSDFVLRRRWTEEEMEVASRNFKTCLTKGYLPSVYQCQQVISENEELKRRTPAQLKAWVNNQIKKKVKQEGGASSTAGDNCVPVKRRSKCSKRVTRCRWSNIEQHIVKMYFAHHLVRFTLPSTAECRVIIAGNGELSHRTPEQVRAWVYSQNKKRNVENC